MCSLLHNVKNFCLQLHINNRVEHSLAIYYRNGGSIYGFFLSLNSIIIRLCSHETNQSIMEEPITLRRKLLNKVKSEWKLRLNIYSSLRPLKFNTDSRVSTET